jgi:xanthine dehydrogenase YagT iron-sulfur-binding subunit
VAIEPLTVNLTVNDQARRVTVEPRMTLLDALREKLTLTGTKKACDRGEYGTRTVHVEGKRILSCMTLAAMVEGKRITTIEGLERNGKLHPAHKWLRHSLSGIGLAIERKLAH